MTEEPAGMPPACASLLAYFAREMGAQYGLRVADPRPPVDACAFDLIPPYAHWQLWMLPTRDRSSYYAASSGDIGVWAEPPLDIDDALKLRTQRAAADILRARDIHPVLNWDQA